MKSSSLATSGGLRASTVTWIVLAALAVRWASAYFASQESPFWLGVNTDDRVYDEWARRIAGGQWTQGETFFLSPGYPYFLALLYGLFDGSRWAAIVVQVVLSSVTVGMLAQLAARLFDARTGIATGILACLYGPLIFFSESLLSETLHLFLAVGGLVALERGERKAETPSAIVAGVLFGLAAVVRAYFLLTLAGLASWWLYRACRTGVSLRPLAWMVFGATLALMPSALHNRIVGGEWVLVNASGGVNAYLGNHPGADGRIHPPPGFALEGILTPGRMQQSFSDRAGDGTLTPGALSKHYYGKARAWATGQPTDWGRLIWRKLMLVLESYECPGDRNYYQAQRWSPILRWTPVSWPLILALAAGALWGWRSMGTRIGMLYWCVGSGLVVLLVFLVTDRFRLILLPAMLVFAGSGANSLLGGARRSMGRWGRWVALGLCLLSLHLGSSHVRESYMSHFNLALQQLRIGQTHQAEASLRESIRLRPSFLRGHGRLAQLLHEEGRSEEARDQMVIVRRLAREQGIPLGPRNP